MRKITTLLLAAVLLLSNAVFPVCAMQIDPEDPMAIKDFAVFGAPLMETEPEETVQKTIPETQPAQTDSAEPETEPVEETISQETVPVETVPAETLAEETVPGKQNPPRNLQNRIPMRPRGTTVCRSISRMTTPTICTAWEPLRATAAVRQALRWLRPI